MTSKVDWAKYPLSKEAVAHVESLDLGVEELASPEFTLIVERAEQRVREAVLSGAVRWKETPDYEVEILSFPAALVLLSIVRDDYLNRRYALAEAKRVYDKLSEEDNDKLVAIADNSLGWGVKIVSTDAGDYNFTLKFTDYLKHAPEFHDDSWKLVNRTVVKGEVFLAKNELARLMAEEVRAHIEERLKSSPKVEAPPPLTDITGRIIQLLAQRKEAIRVEELPKEAVGEAYPLCVKKLYDAMIAKQHLSHVGRFTLTSFLLNVGIDSEKLVRLYASITDFDERLTRYQVEHIAGKRGSGTRYTPPNCETLRTHGLCPGKDEICRQVKHPLTYYRRKLRAIRGESSLKEGR